MKRTITLAVCLMIFQAGQINATVEVPPTDKDSLTHESKKGEDNKTTNPKKDSGTLYSIPNGKLYLSVDNSRETLDINLTGVANENLVWIIHKPKGNIVSRIKTSANIDKILIDSLDSGNYVLMIKDESGRILHQPFTKDQKVVY